MRGRPKGSKNKPKNNVTILKAEPSIKDVSKEPDPIPSRKEGDKRDQRTEEQYYALKRAYSMLEGRVKDNFKEPLLCQAIFEGAEFLKKFIDKYERREK